jgi:hypothetical protein
MRVILTAVLIGVLSLSIVSCKKYKLVNVEEEKAKQAEEKLKELEDKLKQLEEEKKDKPQVVVVEKKGDEKGKTGDKPQLSGYVRLYDDAGFTDRILTVRFGRDIGNMHYVRSDDGKSGFNDKASSVKYSVPDGWQAVLYENNNYSKRGYALKGSGSIPDLGYFGDKCSSLRWERAQ